MHCCRGRLSLSFLASSSALDLERALLVAQRKICCTSSNKESDKLYRGEHAYQISISEIKIFLISVQTENQTNNSPYMSGNVSMVIKRIYITLQKNPDDVCCGD